MDLPYPGKRVGQIGDAGEMLPVVVDAGNHRAAQVDDAPCFRESAHVFVYRLERTAGELKVSFGSGLLAVDEEEVGQVAQLEQA